MITNAYQAASSSLGQRLMQSAIATVAAEKKIKPLPADLFIVADGQTVCWGERLSRIGSLMLDCTLDDKRLEQIGTYNTNNGIVTLVNEKGQTLVAPLTQQNIAAIQEAGYRRDGAMFVHLSNGEYFTNPHLKKQFAAMVMLSLMEAEACSTTAFLRECLENATKANGGKEPGDVPAEGFMEADGLVYIVDHGSRLGLKSIDVARGCAGTGRTTEAGTFSTNNGIIAVVDKKGRLHLGAATTENAGNLYKAGYRIAPSSFFVPLSNGEIPVGWSGQLDAACSQLYGGVDTGLIMDINRLLERNLDPVHAQRVYEQRIAPGKRAPEPSPP